MVSDPSPTAPGPEPSPSPAATPPPGPPVTDYTPNYVPNLTATRRWDRNVVTVRVAPPSVGSAGTAPDSSLLVQEAIDLWNQKVGQEIQFQLVSGAATNPDVTIDWVPASSLPGETIGQTQVQFRTGDQVLIAAQIAVVESLPDSFKVQVVAHELGHAMGIDGHSADASDLMYTNSHLPAVVTASDQNTVLWSYEVGPTRSVALRSSRGAGTGMLKTVCGGAR